MDTEERSAFASASDAWMVRGGGVEVVVESPIHTEEMILNIGPQHPSTHGVLRVVLELDGERIVRAEPVIGYMHRAAEKLAEYRDTTQVLVLMNRHDWLSAFNNELGWVIAMERMLEIEGPDRAQWIRTMVAEWNRILHHLVFCGSLPLGRRGRCCRRAASRWTRGRTRPTRSTARWTSTCPSARRATRTTGCGCWSSGCGSRARSSSSAWRSCPPATSSRRSFRSASRCRM